MLNSVETIGLEKSTKDLIKMYVRKGSPVSPNSPPKKIKLYKQRYRLRPLIGLLLAVKKDDKVYIGWSKKHKKDPHFYHEYAEEIAMSRINAIIEKPRQARKHKKPENEKPANSNDPFIKQLLDYKIPQSLHSHIVKFKGRCIAFFKVSESDIFI